jgi:hypothetical protein
MGYTVDGDCARRSGGHSTCYQDPEEEWAEGGMLRAVSQAGAQILLQRRSLLVVGFPSRRPQGGSPVVPGSKLPGGWPNDEHSVSW